MMMEITKQDVQDAIEKNDVNLLNLSGIDICNNNNLNLPEYAITKILTDPGTQYLIRNPELSVYLDTFCYGQFTHATIMAVMQIIDPTIKQPQVIFIANHEQTLERFFNACADMALQTEINVAMYKANRSYALDQCISEQIIFVTTSSLEILLKNNRINFEFLQQLVVDNLVNELIIFDDGHSVVEQLIQQKLCIRIIITACDDDDVMKFIKKYKLEKVHMNRGQNLLTR
jgi:hypothetical protein